MALLTESLPSRKYLEHGTIDRLLKVIIRFLVMLTFKRQPCFQRNLETDSSVDYAGVTPRHKIILHIQINQQCPIFLERRGDADYLMSSFISDMRY